MLLTLRQDRRPCVLLFRHGADRRPERQVASLLANLDTIEKDLLEECVAVLEPGRFRVRRLPIGEE
jgi:hypothetical protein